MKQPCSARRFIGALLAAALMCFASLVSAEVLTEHFSAERFAALQKENALILVDVHAPWCPTCARQQKILDDYQAQRPQAALHRLMVDFDNDKQWVTAFKAPRQSTLILFRGDKQEWFSVAETRPQELFAALDRAAGITP